MADKDVIITNATKVSSLNDTDYALINQGSTLRQVLISDLVAKVKTATASQVESDLLDRLTEGVRIYSCGCSYRASEWTAEQKNGSVADGVLIMQTAGSGHHLVVAPTEASLEWSSQMVLVGDAYDDSSDLRPQMNDFYGQSNTKNIVNDSTLSADGASYAPGYCYAYARDYIQAGEWWLPSLGEMWAVLANALKINACLALIDGATQLNLKNWYWTSTEYDEDNAWFVGFNYGCPDIGSKDSSNLVRPVSAFKY